MGFMRLADPQLIFADEIGLVQGRGRIILTRGPINFGPFDFFFASYVLTLHTWHTTPPPTQCLS